MIFRKITKYLSVFLIFTVIGFGLWFWATLKFSFSNGERAGYIQKFSKRGWVFKTWEGELAMVNLPGTMPEKFEFSVVDKDVPAKIQATMGQRVIIKYDQHRYIPLPIFSETEYFVTDVTPVQDSVAPSPLPTVNK